MGPRTVKLTAKRDSHARAVVQLFANTVTYEETNDLTNAQFPSDENWELRIEHWSELVFNLFWPLRFRVWGSREHGGGAARKQLAAVRQLHLFGVGDGSAALGAIALDLDGRAEGHGVFPPAHPQQRVGGAHFEAPVNHTALFILDVHVNPGVRIHPVHLGDGAFHGHWLFGVEFRGERMMRAGGKRKREQSRGNGD